VTVLRWARWARVEVQAWPDDLSRLDVTAEFSRIVSAANVSYCPPAAIGASVPTVGGQTRYLAYPHEETMGGVRT
jgi:hypothetical protein